MLKIKNEAFKKALDSSGLVDAIDLKNLLSAHGDNHFGILLEMVERSLVPKKKACQLWADNLNFTYVDPLLTAISCSKEEMLPLEIARKAHAICLYSLNGIITVAMANPSDRGLLQSLENILQTPLSPVFSLPEDIEAAISIHYAQTRNFSEALEEVLEKSMDLRSKLVEGQDVSELVRSTPLIDFFNSILFYAFQKRATDIHIEASYFDSKIRFRIDGNMTHIINIPNHIHTALVIRIKVLCNLNIVQTRLPQDGRFSIQIGDFIPNFRVSTLPGLHGEKAVIRILGATDKKNILDLDNLMMSDSVKKPLRRIVSSPNGIFIVTGPTGSGKTTTLYAALNYINSPKINLVSIEDPVEYQLEGVNHFQVNNEIGLTFAGILRSVLRQDPDVILIGEIRDLETAKIATEAALTGHFVMTTLHTNNALQAVIRLVEIGVDPYLVAPSTIGVLSQRLAGRICDRCREVYYPDSAVLRKYFIEEDTGNLPFYRGKGCKGCNHTGFFGRVALHEILEVSEEMRALIAARNCELRQLCEAAKRIGYRAIRYDGLKKVLLGATTIEEVERTTIPEYTL